MPALHEHDDLHDRGLAFDLATLRTRATAPARLERRGALKLLAGASAGLVLVACGSDSKDASTTTSSSTTSTTAGSGGSTTTTGSGTSSDAIPEETGGPFPGDGSNGPNVLTETGIVREDIRSSFGDYSGTAEGVPLTIALTLVEAASGTPLDGAAMYLWHCSRDGGYSLYSNGVTDQNFLRGVQETNGSGLLTFTSIYPAAYDGRWPHIHFEIFESLDAATGGSRPLITSQLALPEGASREVYLTSGYEQSLDNLAQSSLDSDMVFSDGVDSQMATVEGAASSGMSAFLTIGV